MKGKVSIHPHSIEHHEQKSRESGWTLLGLNLREQFLFWTMFTFEVLKAEETLHNVFEKVHILPNGVF